MDDPRCLICEEPVLTHDSVMYATVFEATGNFGSGVYDLPDNRNHLEIVICDGCMLASKDRITEVQVLTTVERTVTGWEPEDVED